VLCKTSIPRLRDSERLERLGRATKGSNVRYLSSRTLKYQETSRVLLMWGFLGGADGGGSLGDVMVLLSTGSFAARGNKSSGATRDATFTGTLPQGAFEEERGLKRPATLIVTGNLNTEQGGKKKIKHRGGVERDGTLVPVIFGCEFNSVSTGTPECLDSSPK